MPVDLEHFSNNTYRPGSLFKRMAWHYCNAIFLKTGIFPFYGLKVFLLRLFGAKIGRGVLIKPYVNIKYPWFLEVGDHVWIGEGAWIDNLARVQIGDHVCISQGALILSGNHNYSKPGFDLVLKEIVLEDGVWICAGATVCQGVTCHSHAVLGVGSVAVKDLDAYGIYRGNPAEKLKERIIQ